MLHEIVPPSFSVARLISTLIKAHGDLTCQKALYHVHDTISSGRGFGKFSRSQNQARVIFTILYF